MTINQTPRYKFMVTGASGNVGRRLIPLLAQRSEKILALGRDASILKKLYSHLPEVDVADYATLAHLSACDTLVHLAVLNNDQSGSLEDFIGVNVDFSTEICGHFERMGGRRFINISSIHSLDKSNSSPYAVSKELSRQALHQLISDRLDTTYIGYFYHPEYYGEKLGFLSRLGIVGKTLFGLFKTLKPTTSAKILAEYVLTPVQRHAVVTILTDDMNEEWAYRAVRRVYDLAVALGILVLLFPVLFVLWALIRLDSPGSPIFSQTRVGEDQAQFTLYKFRTMKRDTVSAGTHEVNVSAVTKIGGFLRRTKLDELPQAINLLRGDMTLVGPRPCLPVQEELLNARERLGVYAMKPGITGYAQIRQIDMSRPDELAQSDAMYMKLQSLTLNCKIVLMTALGRGAGDRVVPTIEP